MTHLNRKKNPKKNSELYHGRGSTVTIVTISLNRDRFNDIEIFS
jgi:hypothetical protein